MALSNEEYNKIIAVYDERRKKSTEEYDARIKEIYAATPEYRELCERIKLVAADRAMALVRGDEELARKLAADIEGYMDEKKSRLALAGFPVNYDEMTFVCDKCKDTGYVEGVKCSCFRQMQAELLYDSSMIKDVLERENFDTFSFEYFDNTKADERSGKTSYENMQYNYDVARNFVSDFKPGSANLLFYGESGTGKTFLSNCIAREILRKGYSVVYLSATELFDKLAGSRYTDGEDKKQILGCDLLIIDDLGTEFNNAYVSSMLFEVINTRALKNVSTIISMNLDMNGFRSSYSERISSRILEHYTVCRFFNQDIRLLKRRENLRK